MSIQVESNPNQTIVRLLQFQDNFLFSERRFPAFIAAVGTGKTYMGLLKVWKFCEKYPGSLWVVVRKEYTDLRDSTLKDFTRYFKVMVDSNKEYRFDNGSTIMFRHGAEVNVLKNITLDGYLIEQAEEFIDDEQFVFLRDRLRGKAGPYQQGCILANANGHNWIWDGWVDNEAVDGSFESTGDCLPRSKEHYPTLARLYDNEVNLPPAYIEDQRRVEIESPNHYKQYVLNMFDTELSDDSLFSPVDLSNSVSLQLDQDGYTKRIMGIDVARYGGNEIVYSILESRGVMAWEQIHQEAYINKGIDETLGKTIALIRDFDLKAVVIDDDGLGGGLTDLVKVKDVKVIPFRGGLPVESGPVTKSNVMKPRYDMTRSASYFKVQEFIEKGWLKILSDKKLHQQLLQIKFRYKPDGARHILSKEEMRSKKFPSPDRADALMMALWFCEKAATATKDSFMDAERDRVLDEIPQNYGLSYA